MMKVWFAASVKPPPNGDGARVTAYKAIGNAASAVDRLRIDQPLVGDLKRSILVVDRAKEAALVTFVAGRSDLRDPQQNGVPVAIDPHLANTLLVAACLAFAPKFLTRPAEVNRPTGSQRLAQRFGIHPSQHQHTIGIRVLRNHRQQPADPTGKVGGLRDIVRRLFAAAVGVVGLGHVAGGGDSVEKRLIARAASSGGQLGRPRRAISSSNSAEWTAEL